MINLEDYFSLFVFLFVAIAFGVMSLLMGRILGPHKPYSEKQKEYECGFDAFDDAHIKFDVRYYLVAILFILFDLEVIFFFPWSVSFREIGLPGFLVMMVFIAEFIVGFIYVWKKGALNWE